MSRWILTGEVKNKHMPKVLDFIKQIESSDEKSELLEVDFSDKELNPYTLQKLLEDIGYEQTNQDDNGWQLDFWITMEKKGCKPLQICGCGITFELKLTEME